MLQYLAICEELDMRMVDILHLVFQLSFATLGRPLTTETLTQAQQRALQVCD
jgi:hypothetical protein